MDLGHARIRDPALQEGHEVEVHPADVVALHGGEEVRVLRGRLVEHVLQAEAHLERRGLAVVDGDDEDGAVAGSRVGAFVDGGVSAGVIYNGG